MNWKAASVSLTKQEAGAITTTSIVDLTKRFQITADKMKTWQEGIAL